MANTVSVRCSAAHRRNVRASFLLYGCGKRSRRLIQMLRLFAWIASGSASERRHDRTSHRVRARCTCDSPPIRFDKLRRSTGDGYSSASPGDRCRSILSREAWMEKSREPKKRLPQVKRVYDPPSTEDGVRVLVDRLWPRGLSRTKASIDLWLKDLAPSATLRRWFNHDPEKWAE